MTTKPEECDVCGRPEVASFYGAHGGGRCSANANQGDAETCWQLGYERRGVEITVLRAKVADLEQLVCDFQAAAMIDVGGMDGPCAVKPEHVERHVTQLRAQLEDCAKERDEARGRLSDETGVLDEVRAALGEAWRWGLLGQIPHRTDEQARRAMATADKHKARALASAAIARAEGVGGKPGGVCGDLNPDKYDGVPRLACGRLPGHKGVHTAYLPDYSHETRHAVHWGGPEAPQAKAHKEGT